MLLPIHYSACEGPRRVLVLTLTQFVLKCHNTTDTSRMCCTLHLGRFYSISVIHKSRMHICLSPTLTSYDSTLQLLHTVPSTSHRILPAHPLAVDTTCSGSSLHSRAAFPLPRIHTAHVVAVRCAEVHIAHRSTRRFSLLHNIFAQSFCTQQRSGTKTYTSLRTLHYMRSTLPVTATSFNLLIHHNIDRINEAMQRVMPCHSPRHSLRLLTGEAQTILRSH